MAAQAPIYTEQRTVRRAWITVALGVSVIILIGAGTLVLAAWITEHATLKKTGTARVISGSEALWRDSPESEWSIFHESITLEEGDEVSTELGTVIWITLFDGSTLELTERSHIRFSRLRTSRFSDAALQIQVELMHGTIYGAMAPVVDRDYGELEIIGDAATVTLKGDRSTGARPTPVFIVEARAAASAGSFPYRAAALRGQLEVRTATETMVLVGPEQVEIGGAEPLLRSDTIRSEVIANGSFEQELEGWATTYSAEAREPLDRVGAVEAVRLDGAAGRTALHIRRDDSLIWARTGVRQALDRTLRLPAELTLTFEVLVEHQGEANEGRATIPLAIELNYTDILGQDRQWTTVYALRRDDGIVETDAFTTVVPGEWTKVIVDLENLEPIPKILGTLVVYASGGGYESYLSDLSLTTGEGIANP